MEVSRMYATATQLCRRFIVPLLIALAMAAAVAVPASAAPSSGPVPEYYQFCYDRTPQQKLTSKTGTTPKHWYKSAVAESRGVSCKYMYAGVGGFWPKEKSVFYSWSKVCTQMKLGKQGKLDSRKIPYCYS